MQINPYQIEITPLNTTFWYSCPICGGKMHLQDGDSLYIGDKLPDDIPEYDCVDTLLMVGSCKICNKKSYIYEIAFSTVPDPANDGYFCLDNISNKPTKVVFFQAKNQLGETWIIERNIWGKGILPKGRCIIDRHMFGAYLLTDPNKVFSVIGVSRCGKNNDIWDTGSELVYNLSTSAMNLLNRAST